MYQSDCPFSDVAFRAGPGEWNWLDGARPAATIDATVLAEAAACAALVPPALADAESAGDALPAVLPDELHAVSAATATAIRTVAADVA